MEPKVEQLEKKTVLKLGTWSNHLWGLSDDQEGVRGEVQIMVNGIGPANRCGREE